MTCSSRSRRHFDRPSAEAPDQLGAWLRTHVYRGFRTNETLGQASLTDALGWFLALRDSQGASLDELREFARGFCGQFKSVSPALNACVTDGRVRRVGQAAYEAAGDRIWEKAIVVERMAQKAMEKGS